MQLPRFYPILDTEILQRRGYPLLDAASAILEAGASILQLRHKGHYSRELFAAARRVSSLCRSAGALFVINDRADIAALLDSALHIGQDDLTPADARQVLGSHRTLGFSTHNEAQLRAALAQPADYYALGPIYATGSKRNPDPVVGVENLRRLRALADRPLVAIGGITRENAGAVYAAGTDSIAVIADLLPESNSAAALRARCEEWLQL